MPRMLRFAATHAIDGYFCLKVLRILRMIYRQVVKGALGKRNYASHLRFGY
ncbi:MAG TPA: hypothetical protein VGF44_05740 [Terriglobales bacterium]